MTLTQNLVQGLYRLLESPLSAEVERWAVDVTVDAIGCAIHGAASPQTRGLLAAAQESYAPGPAAVWGCGLGLSPAGAAFVNGSLAHLHELDDVNYAILHPGAVVIPAALGASTEGTDGGRFLAAVVAGYEVMTRIGAALPYGEHRAQGWHATATCGPFGAAMAAAFVRGLTAEEAVSALGLAGTRTGGLWAFKADGSPAKRLHAGLASRDGVLAAALAAQGWRGPAQILEAEDGGFLRVTGHNPDFDAVTADLGHAWAIEATQFKTFASCRSVHPVADAMLRLRRALPDQLAPAAIERVEIGVNPIGFQMAGQIDRPTTPEEAMLSIAYGAAAVLAGGDGGPADYTPEAVQRPLIKQLLPRIAVHADQALEAERKRRGYPSAIVKVLLTSGEVLTLTNHDVKGSPANPLTASEIDDKFKQLVYPVLGPQEANHLLGVIREIPSRGPGSLNATLLSTKGAFENGC